MCHQVPIPQAHSCAGSQITFPLQVGWPGSCRTQQIHPEVALWGCYVDVGQMQSPGVQGEGGVFVVAVVASKINIKKNMSVYRF